MRNLVKNGKNSSKNTFLLKKINGDIWKLVVNKKIVQKSQAI